MDRRFSRPAPVLAVLLLTVAIAGATAAQDDAFNHPAYGERSSNETLMERSDLGNVTQTARIFFSEGNRELKKAAKAEKKLATAAIADDSERAEYEAKITAAYEKAVAKFTDAIRNNPKMLDAYTALGETYAKLGKHGERLQVHSAALKLAPGDEANFRGWAGALLALDMLGDATRAWDHFHANDPPKAAILMAEMKGWLERRQADPGGLAEEDIRRMSDWLAARG